LAEPERLGAYRRDFILQIDAQSLAELGELTIYAWAGRLRPAITFSRLSLNLVAPFTRRLHCLADIGVLGHFTSKGDV